MEFVQKFTPPDFKVKNFTPSISPYFNSFSGKQGGITCGAIDEPRKSSKAIDERVIINLHDKMS